MTNFYYGDRVFLQREGDDSVLAILTSIKKENGMYDAQQVEDDGSLGFVYRDISPDALKLDYPRLIEKRGLVDGIPTHFGYDNVTQEPLAPHAWSKSMYSYLKIRPGLRGKVVVIIDPHGHRGKNKFMEAMMGEHGMVGVIWENNRDFKKIMEMITLSEKDEADGKLPELDLIWIDVTRTGDTRLSDPKWHKDLEKLMNGTFGGMNGWGELYPHIVITTNHPANPALMTAGRFFQHVIHRDSVALGLLEESETVEEIHDEQAIVLSRKTEAEHKHKSLEQIWIEHLYANQDGPEEPLNTTQMVKELSTKYPVGFARYCAKQAHGQRIFAKDQKETFTKLIQKHAPALRMSTAGSATIFQVKRPRR